MAINSINNKTHKNGNRARGLPIVADKPREYQLSGMNKRNVKKPNSDGERPFL